MHKSQEIDPVFQKHNVAQILVVIPTGKVILILILLVKGLERYLQTRITRAYQMVDRYSS